MLRERGGMCGCVDDTITREVRGKGTNEKAQLECMEWRPLLRDRKRGRGDEMILRVLLKRKKIPFYDG